MLKLVASLDFRRSEKIIPMKNLVTSLKSKRHVKSSNKTY